MPLLVTPGPLTTAPEVREAMLVDRGSRDPAFVELGARVRARLEALLPGQLRVVPVQGSGTFAVEAMLQSFVPRGGRVLLGVNGAYGRRMADILRRMDCELERVEAEETQPLDPQVFAPASRGRASTRSPSSTARPPPGS
jgi:2-aminoethylphosphonate-pyruvate transaminase